MKSGTPRITVKIGYFYEKAEVVFLFNFLLIPTAEQFPGFKTDTTYISTELILAYTVLEKLNILIE